MRVHSFLCSWTWQRPRTVALALLSLGGLSACASGSAPESAAPLPTTPESVWDALERPRPEPLQGATGVTVSEILLLGDPWGIESPVPTAIGIQELISAGLLRRRDVNFVERRRFAVAAEQERRGQPRPRGAPPVGVSPGADLILSGSWAPLGADSAYLDFRLLRAESSEVAATFRRTVPAGADPTSLARSVTAGLLETLASLESLPRWQDPIGEAAPAQYAESGVPLAAVAAFFRGVAAEDRYDWEGARRAYQAARDAGGSAFFEAGAALARIARLRAGGSLGAGDHP